MIVKPLREFCLIEIAFYETLPVLEDSFFFLGGLKLNGFRGDRLKYIYSQRI
jgi:hypothetical protein